MAYPRRSDKVFERAVPTQNLQQVCRYEHNYSDAEIAKMLGTSQGTIAVTLSRARARLKKLLCASSGDNK